jgi:dihydroneopterin aldolase/2-amino-4-hydroxy-6-hydroxymethyldihydropteridine diphosphokinase
LPQSKDHIVLTGLKISCIIGIFEWERKQKQDVIIDLKFPCDARKASLKDAITEAVDYKKIAKAVIAFVENSQYQLVETLAERLAQLLIEKFDLVEIDLSVSKPAAIRGSQNVGIQIHRAANSTQTGLFTFLSLGSNIHPHQNLQFALGELAKKYSLIGISHVYETSPVGYAKQSSFWNMVVAADTDEKPGSIRKWAAALEKKTGRIKQGRTFGPRTLDVDLILWKNLIEKSRKHILPHPDIETKAFVLFPLLEINPNLAHPESQKTMIEIAASFKDHSQKIKQLSSDIFRNFQPRAVTK